MYTWNVPYGHPLFRFLNNATAPNESLKQSLELFIANVGLSQLNWKTVPQLGACSRKTSVTELSVGPSDDTRPRVGRTQPMSSLIKDELTVRGHVWWLRAGQRAVDLATAFIVFTLCLKYLHCIVLRRTAKGKTGKTSLHCVPAHVWQRIYRPVYTVHGPNFSKYTDIMAIFCTVSSQIWSYSHYRVNDDYFGITPKILNKNTTDLCSSVDNPIHYTVKINPCTRMQTFVHILAKYWSILEISSLLHSGVNLP